MNSYFIKVDRSSIRPNPNYRHQVHSIPGCPIFTEHRAVLVNGQWREEIWEGIDLDTKNKIKHGFLKSWRTCAEKPSEWCRLEVPMQQVYSLYHEPRFIYKHEEVLVECEYCQARFNADVCWCDTGCPKCGEWNCCEIKYEKLTDQELENCLKNVNQVLIEEMN